MINLNFKVGSDNGNSEHDIIIDNKIIRQPNVFVKSRNLPMIDEVSPEYILKNIEDNLIVTINSPSVPPAIYLIGKYALNSGKRVHNMEVGIHNDKANSDIVVVNTLAQIAGQAVNKVYSENKSMESLKDGILVHVDMATSIPIKQYSREKAEILFNRFMADKHTVTVHLGPARVDVTIVFDFVKVLPESVPVVFALQHFNYFKDLGLNPDELFSEFKERYNLKSITEAFFKNKKILHVSIGEGTTEFPVTNDIEFDPNFIFGTDNGVGQATELALPIFKEKTLLRTFSRQAFSDIIKNPDHKYYDIAMDCLEDPLEGESDEILHVVKNELEKANNDVDLICCHGGGSIAMKEFLYDKLLKLGNVTMVKVFYAPEEYAVILEALGLFKFVNSNLFNALKKYHSKG